MRKEKEKLQEKLHIHAVHVTSGGCGGRGSENRKAMKGNFLFHCRGSEE